MKGVNYVTNDEGVKTALLIDLSQLKEAENSGADLADLLEDLEDKITIELSKGAQGRPYEDVRKEILNSKK